ncbi:MAG: UTP--glucose-1-phosphate uridylyltransferase, partial [Planctomycetes bacterium]|nr:UTP--glucose-1-phosphate uridylyltransferase [Planctomycetota bacterium]
LARKRELEHALPFAMDPVVYDFAVNERGSVASLRTGDAALPDGYYLARARALLERGGSALDAIEAARGARVLAAPVAGTAERGANAAGLERLLAENGFDRIQHEQIREAMREGSIGLLRNRLPVSTRLEDAAQEDVLEADAPAVARCAARGRELLREGRAAVLTLAAGAGSRWTQGAGVVKALHPFVRLGGAHRSFLDIHLAKTNRTAHACGDSVPHLIATSYLTHAPIEARLQAQGRLGGDVLLSPGRTVGLRLVPMVRDLRFQFEELPRQKLDKQAQKMAESAHAAWLAWAGATGEGADYVDNLPAQCLHPVGHWYEVPNLLRNGTLARLWRERPALRYLLLHNIDTLGADLDPALLGYHAESGAALTFEVVPRCIDDSGGGLARIDGRLRLVEGMALPHEPDAWRLSWYSTMTTWIDLEALMAVVGLSRGELGDEARVGAAVRGLAARLPTYVTLKEVKKRWGLGQEDVLPVAQFEKLWGDMSVLPEVDCRYVAVPRVRGQQLKEPAQLDGWLRDGSVEAVAALCRW